MLQLELNSADKRGDNMLRKIFLFLCFGFIGVLMVMGIINKVSGFNLWGFAFDKEYRYYSFDRLHYDVEVLADGDSNVEMELSYNYKIGSFSRVTFNLEGDVSNLSVSEGNKEFIMLNGFDESRPENSFYYKTDGSRTHVELYMRAQKEKRKFTISFKQKGTTVRYSDCAVYFHKFLSQSNDMKIGEVSAKIHMPKGISKDNTLIWGHGAAHGEINFQGDDTILLYIKKPPIHTYVEARAVMPAELFAASSYRYNYENKNNIIRDETAAAKKADKERKLSALSAIAGIVAAAIIILIPLRIRLKERKANARFVPEISPKYFREIESNIVPAVANKLFYYYEKGNHLPKAVSATIVDLMQRGIILVEYGIKKSDITLCLTKDEGKDEMLTNIDKTVINFLFNVTGNKGTVSLRQMRKFCKDKKNASKAYKMLKNFELGTDKMFVKQELEKHKKIEGKFSFVTVFMLLGVIGAYIFISNKGDSPFAGGMMWILISFVIGFILSMNISKKSALLSQKGENSLAMWKGFYNFLNDFTLFDEKELPELFMWERYLVYASALGVAKKVLKKLKLKYPQLNDQEYLRSNNMRLFENMYTYNSTDFTMMTDLTDTFERAVTDVQNVVSNMSRSSSSGSGGGFSDGGSSGGSGSGGFSGGSSD